MIDPLALRRLLIDVLSGLLRGSSEEFCIRCGVPVLEPGQRTRAMVVEIPKGTPTWQVPICTKCCEFAVEAGVFVRMLEQASIAADEKPPENQSVVSRGNVPECFSKEKDAHEWARQQQIRGFKTRVEKSGDFWWLVHTEPISAESAPEKSSK